MSKTKALTPVVHKPFTKDFNKFVKFLFDWMENSSNARDLIYEVTEGDLTYREFMDGYDPLEYDNDKLFGEMWATLKHFKAVLTKKACKAAAKKYSRVYGVD